MLTIPMYAGIASLLVFGSWNAVALIAAWVAKFSIVIERDAPAAEAEEESEAKVGSRYGARSGIAKAQTG